jgi:hypothetical protein
VIEWTGDWATYDRDGDLALGNTTELRDQVVDGSVNISVLSDVVHRHNRGADVTAGNTTERVEEVLDSRINLEVVGDIVTANDWGADVTLDIELGDWSNSQLRKSRETDTRNYWTNIRNSSTHDRKLNRESPGVEGSACCESSEACNDGSGGTHSD